MAPVHDARPVGEEKIVDHSRPQAIAHPELAGGIFAQGEHVAQVVGSEDSLPDRQKVAHALPEAHEHALGIDGRGAGRGAGGGAGRDAEDGNGLGAAHVEPGGLVSLRDGEERARHAPDGGTEGSGRPLR